MNVTCPSCSTVYRVDPAKVPELGVRARCRVCAAVFQVPAPGEAARSSAPIGRPSGETAAPSMTPPPVERVSAQPAPTPPPLPPAWASPPPPSVPQPIPTPLPEPPAPARTTAPRAVTQAPGRPSVAIPPVVAPLGRVSSHDLGRPPAAVPPPSFRPAVPASPTPAAPGGRRLVNPFMSQDPQQKARRLARALISDLVVYYPDRRQEGLRKGNLKEVFGEEIKKSWEEYRDQVGKEIAESTPYFNDALNEILAGGQKIFD